MMEEERGKGHAGPVGAKGLWVSYSEGFKREI
jgi:hypothetical protein